MRPITLLLLLPWPLLLVIAVNGDETTNNACIDNGLDVVDSRVSADDHQLGTLANYSLTVAWDDSIDPPSANRTVEYGTVRTITVDGDVPVGAAIVYTRRSESFRHAGSSTVVQNHDQVAPVTWTFDRVGLFAVSIYLVPDYEANVDNDECLFYANDIVHVNVTARADMIDIAAIKTYENCSLCPHQEFLSVSEVAVFVPQAGVEQTCAGWYQDGINGKLNAELCTVLREIEAQDDTCKCDPASTAAPFAGRVLSRWLATASAILTLATILCTTSALAL
jgi:hypothetical protein